jgi:hypothetical protein
MNASWFDRAKWVTGAAGVGVVLSLVLSQVHQDRVIEVTALIEAAAIAVAAACATLVATLRKRG